jgi:hypothetical protein
MPKTLPSKKANISSTKAKTILSDGEVRGHPLTEKQRGLFGAIAGKARGGGGGPKMSRQAAGAKGGRGLAIGERPRGAMKKGRGY